MKLLFASDIHGSSYWCSKLEQRIIAENPDNIVLLGDLLYHGARNPLSKDYDLAKVIATLNSYKDKIIAVRGNCDSEVDQMVLDFDITADYTTILVDDKTLFCSHGHLYNKEKLPPPYENLVLLNGHTHVYEDTTLGSMRYINIGSVSLPKLGTKNSYVIYQNGDFTIKDMDGEPVSL